MSPLRTNDNAKDAKYNEGKVTVRQQPTEYKQVRDPKTVAETRPTRKFKNKAGSKPRQKMGTTLDPY